LAVAWAQQPASSLKSEFRALAGSLERNSVPSWGRKFNHPVRGEFHEKNHLGSCSAASIVEREHCPRAIFTYHAVHTVSVPSQFVLGSQIFPAGTCKPSAQTILQPMARSLEKPKWRSAAMNSSDESKKHEASNITRPRRTMSALTEATMDKVVSRCFAEQIQPNRVIGKTYSDASLYLKDKRVARLLLLLKQLHQDVGGFARLPKLELSQIISSAVGICGFVNAIEAGDVIAIVLDALETEYPTQESP
jgi:hypothetical protein